MHDIAQKKNWRWSGGEAELLTIVDTPAVKTPGIKVKPRPNPALLPKEEDACAAATD
jgi:hypothetical protein